MNNQNNDATQKLSHVPTVAATANQKKIFIAVTFFFIIMMFLGSLFFGKNSKHVVHKSLPNITPHYNETTDHTYQNSPSSEPMVSAEETELKQKLMNERIKLLLEKQHQNEKIYRLRQSAPIEMYTAEDDTFQSVGNTSALRDPSMNYPQDRSGLTLTPEQAEKLKNYFGSSDSNSQFQQQASNKEVEASQATRIPHYDYTLTQGVLIPGVLQTAINSDLPGMVKANVTSDVYSAYGRRALIPRGSTLVGEYNSGIAMGQRRVFIVWTRLIRPDGISVMLGSPGTDSLGQSGMDASNLNTHFWARFGQASLLSIVGAGLATAGVSDTDQYNSASAYRMAIANSFQQTAGASLASTMNIKPTIHIYQGQEINVFVSKDLSFYDVLSSEIQG